MSAELHLAGADAGDDTGRVTGTGAGKPDAAVQRRTLGLLFVTQIIGGIGISIGLTVGALLAADLAGVGLSGLAQSAAMAGSALLAVPVSRLMRRHGRRRGLVVAYLAAGTGGAVVVVAAITDAVWVLFIGLFLFGAGTTAGLLARYAATDLAPPARRGRHLSLVVWATTVGAVAGPNLAPLTGDVLAGTPLASLLPVLATPFLFSAVVFAVAAMLVLAVLRPDPLLRAQQRTSGDGTPAGAADNAAGTGDDTAAARGTGVGTRAALQAVWAQPAARLGVVAMAVGHLVMVAVMAMTPLHIQDAGHGSVHTLRLVGVVLSVHIAGMYALAPVTGWLTDRYGRRRVVLGGTALLLAACAVSGTAGYDATQLTVGLFLLGLGWSGTMVAGSTLLSESVPQRVRPSAQGLADATMGLAGAAGGALSGVVMAGLAYPLLSLLGALAAAPLLIVALRPVRERLYP